MPPPQELNLNWCQKLDNATLVRIIEGCRYLRRVELWKCVQLEAEAIEELAAQCGTSPRRRSRACLAARPLGSLGD